MACVVASAGVGALAMWFNTVMRGTIEPPPGLEITGLICDQPGGLYRYDEPDGNGGTRVVYTTGEQAANEMHNRIRNRTNDTKSYDTDADAIEDFCTLHGAWLEEIKTS